MTQKDAIHPFQRQEGKENGESSPKIPPATAKPTQPIPSCRRVINVTFTPSQMATSSSKSTLDSSKDSSTSEIEQKLSSVSLTSPSAGGTVVRPPVAKQQSDIQLLMDEYDTDKKDAGGLVVYLVSSLWWKSWQQATVLSSSSSSINDVLPGAIDNTCLLDNKDSSADRLLPTTDNGMPVLRDDVKEGVDDGDFVCLPEAAWHALQSWYDDHLSSPYTIHNTHMPFQFSPHLLNFTLHTLLTLSM